MKNTTKITLAAILVIGAFSISILTVPAFAEWDKFNYPEIQGTIPISSGDDFSQKNTIAMSVAMAVGENSVSDGKAMYAKLSNVNGFLVHKVVLITEDNGYYRVLVDAGNGEALYVSDMIKKDYSNKKASNEKYNEKMKNYYKGMTDEQIAEKKRMSDDEKAQKKTEMKQMFQEYLPLTLEEKKQKLQEYIKSLN